MKKQAFLQIIKAIEKQYALDYTNGGLITRLGDPEINNHRFVYTTPMIDHVLSALTAEFGDKLGWISYFVYEVEFGKKADEMFITKADKTTVKLYSAGHLYDWLVGGEA